MKRIALAVALGALFGVGTQAAIAGDGHHKHGHYYRPGDYQRYHRDHERLHDRLERRAFEREMQHREAHRRPMTPKQHERLHQRLERQELRDIKEHRKFHEEAPRRYRLSPSSHHHRPLGGSGFGIQGRNISFWIGY